MPSPGEAANVPGGQLVGCAEAAPQKEPSGQTPLQIAVARLPVAPKTPGGQSVGTLLPSAQKVPTGQATASGEPEPRGQYQPGEHGPLHSGEPKPLAAP